MPIPDGLDGGAVKTGVTVHPTTGRLTPIYSAAPPTTMHRQKPQRSVKPPAKKGQANSPDPKSPTAVGGAAEQAAIAAIVEGGAPDQTPRFDIINPPLHPKSETTFTYGMDVVKLQRGMLERIADRATLVGDKGVLPPNKRYKFRFLYNPESISVSTSTDAGLVPPELSTSSGLVVGKFPGQETWRFGLMLDRTQEAYDQGIATRGTQVDIDALYRVINGNYGNPGFLYLSAIRVHWGPTTKQSKPLAPFNGYITNLSITHTKFTPRMCPIRSIVDISITRLVGEQGSGSAQGQVATGAAAPA